MFTDYEHSTTPVRGPFTVLRKILWFPSITDLDPRYRVRNDLIRTFESPDHLVLSTESSGSRFKVVDYV